MNRDVLPYYDARIFLVIMCGLICVHRFYCIGGKLLVSQLLHIVFYASIFKFYGLHWFYGQFYTDLNTTQSLNNWLLHMQWILSICRCEFVDITRINCALLTHFVCVFWLRPHWRNHLFSVVKQFAYHIEEPLYSIWNCQSCLNQTIDIQTQKISLNYFIYATHCLEHPNLVFVRR